MSATIPKAPYGHFNLLYFASANTFTGKEFETFPAPLPLRKLFATLEERHPGIRANVLNSCLVTVNLAYVDVPDDSHDGGAGAHEDDDEEIVLREFDEVALIPPVSSG